MQYTFQRREVVMAHPRAIYASKAPSSFGAPVWLDDSLNSVPVVYRESYKFWPDLNWLGNLTADNAPMEFGLELPDYSWSDPIVVNPVEGETHHFTREWQVKGEIFTTTIIPPGNFLVVITHAADDQYQMNLTVDHRTLNPIGEKLGSWRNVCTYLYGLQLNENDRINLTSVVTNLAQPGSTPENNPAMFTWLMKVYNNPP
jgi:hypothetical protein